MEQNEQGMLYPFRISGSRLRQRAQQLRRYGQTLDALALVRRAAEQEDTPGTAETAFSTLLLHAAQLIPVTEYLLTPFTSI